MTNTLHHLAWHDGVELLDVKFEGHPFGKHSHNAYAIGVMEHGIGGNFCRGEKHILPEGTISLMNPDELHDGFSISDSLKYKMIYVSENSMQEILSIDELPVFQKYTAPDIDGLVAAALNEIHARLERKNHAGWKLVVDSEVTRMLEIVMSRYSKARLKSGGTEPGAVRIVKDYLNSLSLKIADNSPHPGEVVTLGMLAKLVDLNQNYLLNVFTDHVGVSPYVYWTARRIGIAKRLLAKRWNISKVAQELGFYDQAHFSRSFKKITGITPGRFVAHL